MGAKKKPLAFFYTELWCDLILPGADSGGWTNPERRKALGGFGSSYEIKSRLVTCVLIKGDRQGKRGLVIADSQSSSTAVTQARWLDHQLAGTTML